ncbi:MAG: glycosyltransferase family 4 protein, partial [Albidovulum sp.]
MPKSSSPLHVLELGTWLTTGGIGRHIVGLRDWLRAHGHRVSLAGTPGNWVNEENEADFLSLDLVAVGGRGGTLPRRLWASARASWRLRRWLKANRPDLMHAHDSTPAFVARIARFGLNIPLIVTYHGSEPERVPGFGKIARGCDLTVTPSHKSAEDLATIGGVPRDRLKVIGLGVD